MADMRSYVAHKNQDVQFKSMEMSDDVQLYGDTTTEYAKWDATLAQIQIVQAPDTGDSDRALYISTVPASTTAGIRQGALAVTVDRTSAVWATWDGNPDCGVKVQVTQRTVSGSNGAVRGLDLLARNRTGSCSWVNGIYATAENYTGAVGCVDVIAGEFHAKNNAVASGSVKVLRVYDESQSSTGTHYAISIDCTNDSAFTRDFCVHLNSGASSGWTNGVTFDGNITNPLDFADTDGTNGATYDTGYTFLDGSCVGKIKVDIGGNTCYIPVYSAVS